MMAAALALDRATFMQGSFERIQNEPGMGGGADPADEDLAGTRVTDESHMNEPFPNGDIALHF